MPDLLEPPPAKRPLPDALKPFQWNRAEAIEARKRSGEAKARAKLEAHLDPEVIYEISTVKVAIDAQLKLVQEQIVRTRKVLNDDEAEWCTECERGGIQPHHRAQLLKALDALLDRQRKLLGIPDPGSRRPAQDRHRDHSPAEAVPMWTEPVQPAPRPPADGHEYDG